MYILPTLHVYMCKHKTINGIFGLPQSTSTSHLLINILYKLYEHCEHFFRNQKEKTKQKVYFLVVIKAYENTHIIIQILYQIWMKVVQYERCVAGTSYIWYVNIISDAVVVPFTEHCYTNKISNTYHFCFLKICAFFV